MPIDRIRANFLADTFIVLFLTFHENRDGPPIPMKRHDMRPDATLSGAITASKILDANGDQNSAGRIFTTVRNVPTGVKLYSVADSSEINTFSSG